MFKIINFRFSLTEKYIEFMNSKTLLINVFFGE